MQETRIPSRHVSPWTSEAGIRNLFDADNPICFSCDLNSFDSTLYTVSRIVLLRANRPHDGLADGARANEKGGHLAAFLFLPAGYRRSPARSAGTMSRTDVTAFAYNVPVRFRNRPW